LDLLLGIFFKLSDTVAGALKNPRLSPLRGVEQDLASRHFVVADRSLLLLVITECCR
jgi:hypothetical protein